MTSVRTLAAALALALAPLPSLAQTAARPLLGPLWYDGPTATTPGNSRMRLVFDATRAAALTPEQWWDYSGSYKRNLAALTLRMPVTSAVPLARAAALTEIAARYPAVRVGNVDLEPVDGGRLAPHL